MSTAKPSKNRLFSPLLLIPIKVPNSPTIPPHRVKDVFLRGMDEVRRECILLVGPPKVRRAFQYSKLNALQT
ncbi:hypothetical protein TNCV_3154051 [Trichonephila clavipes]|nr:hypothetical protein TNCV_3154051 [Trichonephila clavipes]